MRSLDVTTNTIDTEQIRAFFRSALEAKCEGIMVKVLHNCTAVAQEAAIGEKKGRKKLLIATYRPDQRVEVSDLRDLLRL